MRFTVDIQANTMHPRNVAGALQRLTSELINRSTMGEQTTPIEGVLRDVHGAVIGNWKYDPAG